MEKIKLILFGQSITAIIYIAFYLMISFVCWNLYNPFGWIINLPNASGETRFLILFYLLFYYSVLYALVFINKKQILNFINNKLN